MPATWRSAAVGGVTVASADSDPSALERRESVVPVSRSDRRGATDATKRAALSVAKGPAVTRTEDLSSADPRDIARALLPQYGFDSSQFSCLDSLYMSESRLAHRRRQPQLLGVRHPAGAHASCTSCRPTT